MKRKIYTLASVFALSLAGFTAAAQQLPNASFEEEWVKVAAWDSSNGFKDGSNTWSTPGWTISHVVSAAEIVVGERGDGYEGENSAYVYNKNVTNKNIPGYITLGTTWSTAWGFLSGNKDQDGGTFGGIEFAFKPDAISFYYKRTHGSAKPEEPAVVVAYSWKGTYLQTDVPANINITSMSDKREKVTMTDRDRNILGIATDQGGTITQQGTLVAKLNYSIEGDAAEWTPLTVPFEYVSDETPEKFNVVFSAADYFGGASVVGEGNALYIDDVKLIYHSRLESLVLEGLTGFEKGVYSYNVDAKTLPTKEEVLAAATADGKSATVDATIDETEKTVTITVTNVDADEDGQSTHTYTLQYKKAVETSYKGYLNITMTTYDETAPVALNQGPIYVKISDYGDGTCDFLLPDLTVLMPLGDIAVDNVTVTEADGVKTYSGSVEDMVLAEGFIHANVVIGGTIDADGKANLKIDVTWIGGMTGEDDIPIDVTFTTDIVRTVADGYIHVEKGDAWLAEKLEGNLTITPGLNDEMTYNYEVVLSGVTFADGETTVDLGDITVYATTVDENSEVYTYGSEEAEVQLGNGKTATVSMTGTYDTATGLYNVSFTVTVDGETYVFGFTTEAIGASVTDAVKSATLVYGATGAIVVDGYAGNVAVYATDGRLVARATVDGRAEIAVAEGLYVVRTDSMTQKVAVK